MQKKLLGLVLAFGLVQSKLSWASMPAGCDPLELTYIAYENERSTVDAMESGRRFVVEASNNLLRDLNNKTFAGWTFGSEFVTNLTHLRFLIRFQEAMNSMSRSTLQKAATPYAKMIEITAIVEGVEPKLLKFIVDTAKQSALEDVGDFFYTMTASSRKKFVVATFDQATELGGVQGIEFSRSPEFEQIERIAALLKEHYSIRDQYLWTVDRSYQIGIGTSPLDAQFAARLGGSVESNSTQARVFSLRSFKGVLTGIEKQKKKLGDGFADLNQAELVSVFEALRKGYSLKQMEQDASKARVLEKIVKSSKLSNNSSRAVWEAVQRYARTLNFLDHLPLEWFQVRSGNRDMIQSLGSQVSGLMAFDGKGLGAKNYMRFHLAAPKLMAKVKAASEAAVEIMASGQSKETLTDPRMVALFDELNAMRRDILADSNADLQKTSEYLRKSIEEALPSHAVVKVWNSGDDFVVGVANGTPATLEKGLRTVLASQGAPLELRGALIVFDRLSSSSLSQARELLAEPMAEIKESEKRNEVQQWVEGHWDGQTLRFELRSLN
jgi:hypothetical protein